MSAARARVVLVTAPNVKAAEAIARDLVELRLAACVNVVPGLRSHYRWEGKLRRDAEVLLLIKTTAAAFRRLSARVKELHPAKVPEIVALPIVAGDAAYLGWLRESVA